MRHSTTTTLEQENAGKKSAAVECDASEENVRAWHAETGR
jgi:hypothetical protein